MAVLYHCLIKIYPQPFAVPKPEESENIFLMLLEDEFRSKLLEAQELEYSDSIKAVVGDSTPRYRDDRVFVPLMEYAMKILDSAKPEIPKHLHDQNRTALSDPEAKDDVRNHRHAQKISAHATSTETSSNNGDGRVTPTVGHESEPSLEFARAQKERAMQELYGEIMGTENGQGTLKLD
ncbi:hypothetical protein HD806DRAFT_536797 [Xylariaceae sp. AK1471]|nr:hypothetical protein HD806DRAFT_536797 [Xylariaceae sp. AK1471]